MALTPETKAQPSVLAADLEVTGNIHSTGDLIVQAQVHGNISGAVVAVQEWAHVSGDVEAGQTIIDGRIDGRVAAHQVTVTRMGNITGAVHYTSLTVEAGATIEGDLQRIAPAAQPQG